MKLIIFAIQLLFNFHSLFGSSPIDDRFYKDGEFNVYTTLYDDPYVNYDAPPPPPPPDGGIGGTTPGGEAVMISQNLPILVLIAFILIIYYYILNKKKFPKSSKDFNVKEKIIYIKKIFSIKKET